MGTTRRQRALPQGRTTIALTESAASGSRPRFTNGLRRRPPRSRKMPSNANLHRQRLGPDCEGRRRTSAIRRKRHTDTALNVYFPTSNVVATGDTVSLGERYVTIRLRQWRQAQTASSRRRGTYIKIGNDQTKYVPGQARGRARRPAACTRNLLVQVARCALQTQIKAARAKRKASAAKPLAESGAKLPHQTRWADDNMGKD